MAVWPETLGVQTSAPIYKQMVCKQPVADQWVPMFGTLGFADESGSQIKERNFSDNGDHPI